MPLSLQDDAQSDRRDKTDGKKWPQYLAVLTATLAAFSIGTYLSWTSPALPLYNRNGTMSVTDQQGSWICSLVPLGAVPGTIPAGIIADKFGRKWTIWVITIPLFMCWFVLGYAQSLIWIFLARFVAGVSSGAASVVIPMYVSEVAESSIRGSLGTIFQLQITLGILFSYLTGFARSLQSIALLCSIVPAILLLVFPCMPESPVWLIMHGRKKEAEGAIRRLRGRRYRMEEELTRLEESRVLQGDRAGLFELRNYMKATIITLGLMVFQQLSGVNTLIFYANTIFEEAGSSLSPTVSPVVVGVVQVIATYFSTVLIDRAGRKILLFVSSSVMATCMLILSGYFHFQAKYDVSAVSWIPLASFTVFIVIFSVGFGPIPWMMVGELFTNNVKSVASSATAISNWSLAFLVTKCFQDMVDLMGISAAFGTFGLISLAGTVFVAVMVPETKGKTVEEVQIELYGYRNGEPKDSTVS